MSNKDETDKNEYKEILNDSLLKEIEAFYISEHILNVKIPYNKLAMNSENVPHDFLHDVPHGVPCDDTSVIIEMIRNNPKVTRIEMATSIGKTVKTVQ